MITSRRGRGLPVVFVGSSGVRAERLSFRGGLGDEIEPRPSREWDFSRGPKLAFAPLPSSDVGQAVRGIAEDDLARQASGQKKRPPRSLTRQRRMLDIPSFAGASGFHCRHDNFCRSPNSLLKIVGWTPSSVRF